MTEREREMFEPLEEDRDYTRRELAQAREELEAMRRDLARSRAEATDLRTRLSRLGQAPARPAGTVLGDAQPGQRVGVRLGGFGSPGYATPPDLLRMWESRMPRADQSDAVRYMVGVDFAAPVQGDPYALAAGSGERRAAPSDTQPLPARGGGFAAVDALAESMKPKPEPKPPTRWNQLEVD